MDKFAKLFETEEYGDILFLLERVDEEGQKEGPTILMKISHPQIGYQTFYFPFEDTEEGWGYAGETFDSINEVEALGLANYMSTQLEAMLGGV